MEEEDKYEQVTSFRANRLTVASMVLLSVRGHFVLLCRDGPGAHLRR